MRSKAQNGGAGAGGGAAKSGDRALTWRLLFEQPPCHVYTNVPSWRQPYPPLKIIYFFL
jgi:hypothetical protein